ncbi:hypothetical protein ACFSUS_25805 [Spirosoma soli]|uniref:Monoheme cytochrome C n=1 Tax=Spirosoma soli TaxID=1770529 RepID=A0ABW5MCU1_9BACT
MKATKTLLLLAIGIWLSVATTTLSGSKHVGVHFTDKVHKPVAEALLTTADSIRTDPETGLALDDQLMLVKGQCTACHSSKLILQSHFSREKWIERIRWMQRTQKLWDLGESEPAIVNYLVKHYGPLERTYDGRREPLKATKWYKLSK